MQLAVGDVIQMERREWLVTLVNESRARCVPVVKRHVVVRDKLTLKSVEFFATESAASISPQSDVPLLARLGVTGLNQFLGITPYPSVEAARVETVTETKPSRRKKK